MNKAVTALVAVIVLGAAAPYAVGVLLERDADARLKDALTAASFVTVKERSYHRGWLQSEEVITLQLFVGLPGFSAAAAAGDKPALAPLLVTVRSAIDHGPLPGLAGLGLARIDTRIAFGAAGGKPPSPDPRSPLKIETWLNLFGGGTATIRNVAFKDSEIATGVMLSSDPVNVTVRYGGHADSIDTEASVPRLALATVEGSRIDATDFRWSGHSHRALRSIYTGNNVMSLAELSVGTTAATPEAPPAADIKDLRYTATIAASGEYVDLAGAVSAATAHVANSALTQLKFDFAYRHVHMESLDHLIDGLRQTQHEHGDNVAALQADMAAQFKTYGVAILAHDPVLEFTDVEFALPEGAAKLTGAIRFKGANADDFKPPMRVQQLLAKVSVDFDLTMDDGLVEKLSGSVPPGPGPSPQAQQLQSLAEQGYITRTDGKTRVKFAFVNGAVTLNGKPFSPAALQPAPGAQPGRRPTPPLITKPQQQAPQR